MFVFKYCLNNLQSFVVMRLKTYDESCNAKEHISRNGDKLSQEGIHGISTPLVKK